VFSGERDNECDKTGNRRGTEKITGTTGRPAAPLRELMKAS